MSLPLLLWIVGALVLALPRAVALEAPRFDLWRRAAMAILLALALAGDVGPLALGAVAGLLVLQALAAGSRSGALALVVAAGCSLGAAAALALNAPALAFAASIASLALHTGVIPFHAGVVATAERQPLRLVDLGASAIAAALVHLRFIIPAASALADERAVIIVAWGAGASIVGALLALAQRDLRGLWASSYVMHSGMLFAAVGAAGRGHTVGVLLVAVTLALAMGGLGAAVTSLEARVGRATLVSGGGRAQTMPTLAAAFAFFAASGIALPGTAGFIADDLLLHALWEESPIACGVIIVASATLAIALWRGYSAVFLGPVVHRSRAPDLVQFERIAMAVLMIALVTLGVAPMLLISSAVAFFR